MKRAFFFFFQNIAVKWTETVQNNVFQNLEDNL